ncbi:hypothetical protein MED222_06195 [Vibrio sp. MED222]|nr:hypothetical protein MED222_06195 [Vibrio sp. MED222]
MICFKIYRVICCNWCKVAVHMSFAYAPLA